jgi:hypothetical protein
MNLPYQDLQPWAEELMASRKPDFVIGEDYMWRWWVIPRNEQANVYLHRIMHSDDDRALHDHPWANTSVLLSGRYVEHTLAGAVMREAGSVVTREATDAHRLEILPGEHAISLFMTGPKLREWGFHCPQGWRLWTDFVDARDSGQIGRGCA